MGDARDESGTARRARFDHLELQSPGERAEILCQQAREALERHRFSDAVQLCDKALTERPNQLDAMRLRAEAYLGVPDAEAALACWEQYMNVADLTAPEWVQRARCLAELGRFAEAERSCTQALDLSPGLADARAVQGWILLHQSDYDRALAAFSEALAVDPDLLSALIGKGSALRSMDRYAEAVPPLNRALTLVPDSVDARLCRAEALVAEGQLDAAAGDLRHILAILPEHGEALTWLAFVLAEDDKLEEALHAAESALALDSGDPERWFLKAQSLAGLSRLDEALTSCEAGLRIDGDDKDLLELRRLLQRKHDEILGPASGEHDRLAAAVAREATAVDEVEHELTRLRTSASSEQQRIQSRPPWSFTADSIPAKAVGVVTYFILWLVWGNMSHYSWVDALLGFFVILPLASWAIARIGLGLLLQQRDLHAIEAGIRRVRERLSAAEARMESAKADLAAAEIRLERARDRFRSTAVRL